MPRVPLLIDAHHGYHYVRVILRAPACMGGCSILLPEEGVLEDGWARVLIVHMGQQ